MRSFKCELQLPAGGDCPGCFKRERDLRRHVRTVHEKHKDHKCPHCTSAFGQAGL